MGSNRVVFGVMIFSVVFSIGGYRVAFGAAWYCVSAAIGSARYCASVAFDVRHWVSVTFGRGVVLSVGGYRVAFGAAWYYRCFAVV